MLYQNPSLKSWLIKLTCLALFLPHFYLIYKIFSLDPSQFINKDWTLYHYIANAGNILLLSVCLIGSILILWKGMLRTVLTIMCLSVIFNLVVINNVTPILLADIPIKTDSKIRVTLDDYAAPQMDVYCNDIYLGKTPLTLNKTEFDQKVSLVETPPFQPMTSTVIRQNKNITFEYGAYTNAPATRFENSDYKPLNVTKRYRGSNEQVTEAFKKSRYWWRFEKQGLSGLTGASSIAGISFVPGHYNPRGYHTYQHPGVRFPAVHLQGTVLLELLEDQNFNPSEGWIDHVLKYEDFLIPWLVRRNHQEGNLTPILNILAEKKYGYSSEPSEEKAREVLDRVVKEVERTMRLCNPSLETIALEQTIPHAKKHFTKLIKDDLPKVTRYDINKSNSNNLKIQLIRKKEEAKIHVLQYALIHIYQPEEIYKDLLYNSRKDIYDSEHELISKLDLILNYEREETLQRLKEVLALKNTQHQFFHLMELYQNAKNPEAISILNNYIFHQINLSYHSATLPDAIQSKYSKENPPPAEVIKFIVNSKSNTYDKDKILHLNRFHTVSSDEAIVKILKSQSNDLDGLFSQLCNEKSLTSAIVPFLIKTYMESLKQPKSRRPYLYKMMTKFDTPEMKEFILSQWDESKESREQVIDHFRGANNWGWLKPRIFELKEDRQLANALSLLPENDYGETLEFLRKQAKSNSELVASKANDILKKLQEKEDIKTEHLKQAEDLISGDIQPDDLIENRQPLKWTENGYIPIKGS